MYFTALVDYLKTHRLLTDPLLKHVEVATQAEASSQSLRFFIQRFPRLLPSGSDVNMISEQFGRY